MALGQQARPRAFRVVASLAKLARVESSAFTPFRPVGVSTLSRRVSSEAGSAAIEVGTVVIAPPFIAGRSVVLFCSSALRRACARRAAVERQRLLGDAVVAMESSLAAREAEL